MDVQPAKTVGTPVARKTAKTPLPKPSLQPALAGPRDATQLYLREIGYASLLSPEEEVHIARLVRKGDEAARKRMIESNLRLVVKIARRYTNRGMSLIDLIEEGNLGLMHAVEKFDPERGFRFSTYSTWWIRHYMERALMNQGRMVRLPVHVAKEFNVFVRAVRELTQKLQHEPSPEEIAERLGRSIEDVNRLLTLNERVHSLNAPLDSESDLTFGDMLADPDSVDPSDDLQENNLNQQMDRWLDKLTEKQRDVLMRRFGLRGYEASTLEEVGAEIGLTRERVRQIQLEAQNKLREMMEGQGLGRDVLFT